MKGRTLEFYQIDLQPLTFVPREDLDQHIVIAQGLTEEQALEQYKNLDLYTTSFRPMRNTISGSPIRTFMKMVG